MSFGVHFSWSQFLVGLVLRRFQSVNHVRHSRSHEVVTPLHASQSVRPWLSITVFLGPLYLTWHFPVGPEKMVPLQYTLPSENQFTRILPR